MTLECSPHWLTRALNCFSLILLTVNAAYDVYIAPGSRRWQLKNINVFLIGSIALSHAFELAVDGWTYTLPALDDTTVVMRLSFVLMFSIQSGRCSKLPHRRPVILIRSWEASLGFEVLRAVLIVPTPFSSALWTWSQSLFGLVFRICCFLGLILHWRTRRVRHSHGEERPLLGDEERRTEAQESTGPDRVDLAGFKSMLCTIWKRLDRRSLSHIFLSVFATYAYIAAEGSIPYLFRSLIDKLYNTNNGMKTIAFICGLIFSETFLLYIQQQLWSMVVEKCKAALTHAAFTHAVDLPRSFHVSHSASDTRVAIGSGSGILEVARVIILELLPNLIRLLLYAFILCSALGLYLGYVVLLSLLAMVYGTNLIDSSAKQRESIESYYKVEYTQTNSIEGWQEVRYFNQQDHVKNRHHMDLEQYRRRRNAFVFSYSVVCLPQAMIVSLGMFLSLTLTYSRFQQGNAILGDLVMVFTYWISIIRPLIFFASVGKDIRSELIKIEKYLKVLQQNSTAKNENDKKPLQITEGKIEFRDVFYHYDQSNPVLKNMCFVIGPREKIAIVGRSGQGKSTATFLTTGDCSPSSGWIKIDDTDISTVNLRSMLNDIGIVPQNPELVDGSIAANIRAGRDGIEEEDLNRACEYASILEKIRSLPKAYETEVGPKGGLLSGGEKQRLAIARAVVKNPKVLILDEPISSIDPASVSKIMSRLVNYPGTVVMITHDLARARHMDRILYVEDGHVKEEGTYQQLMDIGGVYYKDYVAQHTLG